jgi:hypothetical protein
VVIDEVVRRIEAGLTPADAVAELEAQRGSTRLRTLQDSLTALSGQRQGRQQATGRAKGKGQGKGKGQSRARLRAAGLG